MTNLGTVHFTLSWAEFDTCIYMHNPCFPVRLKMGSTGFVKEMFSGSPDTSGVPVSFCAVLRQHFLIDIGVCERVLALEF